VQVTAVSELRDLSESMRTYLKDSGGGPLVEFSKSPTVEGDAGDGGGVAVFATLPLRTFGNLALTSSSFFGVLSLGSGLENQDI
jgi:hypothetical protein